jgi:hypothetical protein
MASAPVFTAATRLQHEHKDLIHDVAYDFYGRRMATCSSDQMIRYSALAVIYLTCI